MRFVLCGVYVKLLPSPTFRSEIIRRVWTESHCCPSLGRRLLGILSFLCVPPRDRPDFACFSGGLPATGRLSYPKKSVCVTLHPEFIPRLLPSPRLKPFHPLSAPAAPWSDPCPRVAGPAPPPLSAQSPGAHTGRRSAPEAPLLQKELPRGSGAVKSLL